MSSTDISSPSRTRPQRTDGTTVARWLRASIDDGLLREAALVAGAILAYFAIRNLTAGAPGEAFANGERMVDLERSLGVAREDAVQASIVGRDSLVMLANWVYIWGHWPVILSTAVVLYVWRPDRYYLVRNTLFISGGIGFLFFAFVPVAPPRLLELGLVDTRVESIGGLPRAPTARTHESVRRLPESPRRVEPGGWNRPVHDDYPPCGSGSRSPFAARYDLRSPRHCEPLRP